MKRAKNKEAIRALRYRDGIVVMVPHYVALRKSEIAHMPGDCFEAAKQGLFCRFEEFPEKLGLSIPGQGLEDLGFEL